MMDTPDKSSASTRQIARAAGTVMLAFVFSNLAGLARDIVISHAFGTTDWMDAFVGASRISDLLFNLVAGGALASAFVPTFTGLLTRQNRAGAWRLAASVANLLLVVLTAASLAAAVFAPQLVRYVLFALDPTFNPAQVQLTVALLRIMLPGVVIFGLSGLVMGILNANQVFLIPALAPAMWSLGQIGTTLLFPESWGIYRLAAGYVLGAGLHLAVQLPALLRLPERRYHWTFGLENADVRRVVRLMGPRVFSAAVVQLNFIVNTMIAFSLPVGSASAINYAFKLMMMPQMAIAQSIAIAALPTFSAQAAQGKWTEMRSSLVATLRGILFLALPASIGLILLRGPIVALVYQRGQFSVESTQMVAWALLWYAAGLVGHSILEIVTRAFFALHDTRTPVLVSVGAMTLNILFSLWFSTLFRQAGWFPHGGLALGNSLATFLETIVLLVLLRRKLKGIEGLHLASGFGQALAAAGLMGLIVAAWLLVGNRLPVSLLALGGIAFGTAAYGLSVWFLKVPEARQAARMLMLRLRPLLPK
jgi:putative peptidoglycan lipid II flippase